MLETKAVIHSLNQTGKDYPINHPTQESMDMITIIKETPNQMLVKYKNRYCTAVLNPFNNTIYVDDVYGIIENPQLDNDNLILTFPEPPTMKQYALCIDPSSRAPEGTDIDIHVFQANSIKECIDKLKELNLNFSVTAKYHIHTVSILGKLPDNHDTFLELNKYSIFSKQCFFDNNNPPYEDVIETTDGINWKLPKQYHYSLIATWQSINEWDDLHLFQLNNHKDKSE